LHNGDFWAVFSDGIEGAFDAEGEEFGLERTEQCLLDNRHGSAEEIYRETIRTVADFRGKAELSDDITLILLKRV
jgi:serine phosphatase RsbU (regulator of sigma subunit)